jgi:hypothetical protein
MSWYESLRWTYIFISEFASGFYHDQYSFHAHACYLQLYAHTHMHSHTLLQIYYCFFMN